MPNYRYIGPYPKLYPDIRDVNGKSLDATDGTVVAWDSPPPAEDWAPTDQPVTWVGQDMRPVVDPAPEPVKPAVDTFPADLPPEVPMAVAEVPEVPDDREPEPVLLPDEI